MIEKIKELIELIDEAEQIYRADTDWYIKFKLIFNMGIGDKLGECNLSVNYYNDGPYEDDVCDYMCELLQLKEKLMPILKLRNNDE